MGGTDPPHRFAAPFKLHHVRDKDRWEGKGCTLMQCLKELDDAAVWFSNALQEAKVDA